MKFYHILQYMIIILGLQTMLLFKMFERYGNKYLNAKLEDRVKKTTPLPISFGNISFIN